MREREAQAVFSRFGQDGHERIRRERLEFVNVEIKVATLGFGDVRARHRRQFKLRDEERAQEICLVRTQFSFRHVRDEYAALVHHETGVNAAANLPQDIPQVRRHQKLPDLVLDWCDHFLPQRRIQALEFFHPKRAHHRIIDLFHHPGAIFPIGEYPLDAQHTDVLAVQQRGDRGIQNIFHARPPGI